MSLTQRYVFVFDALPECNFIDLSAITAHELEDRLLGGATEEALVDRLLPATVDPLLPPTHSYHLTNTNMTSTHTLTNSLSKTHARPTHAHTHARTHTHTHTRTHTHTLTHVAAGVGVCYRVSDQLAH
jgi:hypothetical protein